MRRVAVVIANSITAAAGEVISGSVARRPLQNSRESDLIAVTLLL